MTTTTYKLQSTRFGEVEYTSEDVISFDDGLIGFPENHNYVVICPKADGKFRWLQSVEEPALAFLVTDPFQLVPEYDPHVSNSVAAELELEEGTPQLVFVTVGIPRGKPEEMTLNLAGPIIANPITRRARQVVLEDEAYTTKYRVFHQTDRAYVAA